MIFAGNIEYLSSDKEFQKLMNRLYKKNWVVYAKPAFGGPGQVYDYLGRYTHRVAISNNRIVKLSNDRVTFTWRDRRNDNEEKEMTLDVFEFIRRFLLHILPKGFCKIRYYGLLGSRNLGAKLVKCKELLGVDPSQTEKMAKKLGWAELLYKLTGVDPTVCPCCGKGKMVQFEILYPPARASPL